MLVVYFLLLLTTKINCNSLILPEDDDDNKISLVTCVTDIVQKYFADKISLTYVDFNFDDDSLLRALNKLVKITLVIRKPSIKMQSFNEGYLIMARDTEDFLNNFHLLQYEADWSPSSRFVIIIENLYDIEKIFAELLNLHVINAIAINGTNQADIYTYNPFGNYACGRYFDRVLSYGPCATPRVLDFFPEKLENGLYNCTINIAVSHFPPLTFRPDLCDSKEIICVGTEQYAFQMMSELEHFHVNYTYVDFAQEFSDINDNMTAIGSFSMIQKNQTDGLFGFTLLSKIRAKAFSYIYEHTAFSDEFVYVVKKADFVPVWKYLYLEFDSAVWVALFFAVLICSATLTLLSKPKDKIVMLLKIWDSLFLHGFMVKGTSAVKLFLLVWIWFAFLINSFYQSSLMSLTTNPSKEIQISSEADLINAKVTPCVTWAISDFLKSFAEMTFEGDKKECRELAPAFEKICKSHKVYTIAPTSLYQYSAVLNSEETELYPMKEPVMKVIYALFLYKGFPWRDQLGIRALQLRENGLIDKHTQKIIIYNKIKHRQGLQRKYSAPMVVPWVFLLLGSIVAAFVFLLEVLGKEQTN